MNTIVYPNIIELNDKHDKDELLGPIFNKCRLLQEQMHICKKEFNSNIAHIQQKNARHLFTCIGALMNEIKHQKEKEIVLSADIATEYSNVMIEIERLADQASAYFFGEVLVCLHGRNVKIPIELGKGCDNSQRKYALVYSSAHKSTLLFRDNTKTTRILIPPADLRLDINVNHAGPAYWDVPNPPFWHLELPVFMTLQEAVLIQFLAQQALDNNRAWYDNISETTLSVYVMDIVEQRPLGVSHAKVQTVGKLTPLFDSNQKSYWVALDGVGEKNWIYWGTGHTEIQEGETITIISDICKTKYNKFGEHNFSLDIPIVDAYIHSTQSNSI